MESYEVRGLLMELKQYIENMEEEYNKNELLHSKLFPRLTRIVRMILRFEEKLLGFE